MDMGGQQRVSSLLTVAAAIAVAACGSNGTGGGPSGVSPQPLPVWGMDPALRQSRIRIVRAHGATVLQGADGAATVEGLVVRAFALDAHGVSAQASATKSGAFDLTLDSATASSFYIEGEVMGLVAAGLELELAADGTLAKLPRPICVAFKSTAPIVEQSPAGTTSTFSVSIEETCGQAHALSAALCDGTKFRLDPVPAHIDPHASVTFKAVHGAAPAGEDVDVLVVEDGAPGALVLSMHAVSD